MTRRLVAVVPVRAGVLPLGADDAAAACDGRVVLVGSGTAAAARELTTARQLRVWEAGEFAAGGWAGALAPELDQEWLVVLPASPDGRDLAPRLAAALHRPLLPGAVEVGAHEVVLTRHGDLATLRVAVQRPAVATLQPGVRGALPRATRRPRARPLEPAVPPAHDATVVEVLDPDPATMDLAESPRILAGGAGLRSAAAFGLLERVAAALGASMGATRVIADAGWVPFERQIGTTGVTVDPRLYVAFGISGAVQHVAGIGAPDHVVAVNTDASCPMMARADLALVTDAPAMLQALAQRLGVVVDG